MYNKIISRFSKSSKLEKESKIFHTNEDLYFMREEDGFNSKDHPKFSYKDFNKNEDFKSYIKDGSRLELYYKDEIISEAHVIVSSYELDKVILKFGWINSPNALSEKKPIGVMTFLVASIIYILLKDNELSHRDIEVSLEIQGEAKRLLEDKKIDVYYRIFRTKKELPDDEPIDIFRSYTFKAKNRFDDKKYFKGILESKEDSIKKAITNKYEE